jgi:hypothetical protein
MGKFWGNGEYATVEGKIIGGSNTYDVIYSYRKRLVQLPWRLEVPR